LGTKEDEALFLEAGLLTGLTAGDAGAVFAGSTFAYLNGTGHYID
jgi:hypothetical protein